MATPSARIVPNQGHGQQKLQAHRKSAMKTKSSAMSGQSAAIQAAGDNEEDDDSDDSSIMDEDDEGDALDEADAMALSNAHTGEQRLAGLKADNVFFDDIQQAVAGAAMDSANASDDDDYAGVEEISDDEGSVKDSQVMRAAEADLIDEFERTEERRNANVMTAEMDTMFLQDDDALARRLSLASNGSQPNESDPFNFDVDMNADPFSGFGFGDSQYQELYNDAESALSDWRNDRHNSEDSLERKKKVRFQEPHEVLSRSSSMSSSEDQGEAFPDLFAAHDDPSLRAHFGLDVDLDAGFQNDDAGSCYDFDGEEERLALAIDEESDTDDESSSVECRYIEAV